MTTLSTSASMSTLTSQAWLIFASVRLTSRKRAPLRSAPQNTAPAKIPLELFWHAASRRLAAVPRASSSGLQESYGAVVGYEEVVAENPNRQTVHHAAGAHWLTAMERCRPYRGRSDRSSVTGVSLPR